MRSHTGLAPSPRNADSGTPALLVSTRTLTNESRHRVRMGVGQSPYDDCARMAGAFTDFVVSVGGMTAGERSGIRQAMSTDAMGNVAVELRGTSSLIASSIVSGVFQPLLEVYASDAIDALPSDARALTEASIGIDIWRIHPIEGGILLGVLMRSGVEDGSLLPAQTSWDAVAPRRVLGNGSGRDRRMPSDFYRRETDPAGMQAVRDPDRDQGGGKPPSR